MDSGSAAYLVFLGIIFLPSFLLNYFIYGLGSKKILSDANLNTNYSVILGTIFSAFWMIISLYRARNEYHFKDIIFGVLRLFIASILVTVAFELINPEELKAITGFVGLDDLLYPYVNLFFVFPFACRGFHLYDFKIINNRKKTNVKKTEIEKEKNYIYDYWLKNAKKANAFEIKKAREYLNKGNQAFKIKNYNTAKDFYSKSIKHNKHFAEAYKKRAITDLILDREAALNSDDLDIYIYLSYPKSSETEQFFIGFGLGMWYDICVFLGSADNDTLV